MTAMFISDITEGIAGTGVKAAFLKCAIDAQGLTPGVERVMRAVAQAHLDTGAPVTVHTHPESGSGLTRHPGTARGGRGPDQGGARPQRRHRRPRLPD